MRRISVPEYARIPRSAFSERAWKRLQAFDEAQRRTSGKPVFDWGARGYVRALNYVGVLQVPGATVEILPKIDSAYVNDLEVWRKSEPRHRAQSNLLFMLGFTRRVPLVEKDLASLAVQKLPLLDALVWVFARRLVDELKKGLDHAYVRREENLHCFKGRLLVAGHVQRNAAHAERLFVAYDEFLPDTWLNRILKACCRRLLNVPSHLGVAKKLREAVEYFSGVDDVQIEVQHFGLVSLNRNTERFSAFLDFARLVFGGKSPSPSEGRVTTFSLLFPMDELFEEFVAGYVCRHASVLGLQAHQIRVQAKGNGKWLLSEKSEKEVHHRFGLHPDIAVTRPGGSVDGYQCIVDTKWKRLAVAVEDRRSGVKQADLYQLYAYARQYDCPDNVLLFPAVPGIGSKQYTVFDAPKHGVRVEFLDVGVDMMSPTGKRSLLDSLKLVLGTGGPPKDEDRPC